MRGRSLAVFGNLFEALVVVPPAVAVPPASAVPAPGAGFGFPLAIRTGASAGSVPMTCFLVDTEVTGVSTIFVAVTVMPFFRPHASVSLPSTMNFCPSGIVNA